MAALAVPIFVELALAMLMGNVDTLMLSQFSDKAVAAVGIANQVIFLLIVMFGFIVTGTTVLMSQALGAGNKQRANEIAAISLAANLAIGLLLSGIVFLFQEQILALMNVTGQVAADASSYLVFVGSFMFIQAILVTISAILRSHSFTKDAMYANIGMNVIGIVLNYIVLFEPFGLPSYGVAGVAIATTVSRVLGLIALIVLMKKRIKEPMGLMKVFKMPKEHLQELLRIGLPAAGEQIAYNMSQFVIIFFITTYMGTLFVTTRIYAFNLMNFIMLGSIALAQATQILIARHVGAKEYDDAYKRCMDSLKLSILTAIVTAVGFSFVAEPLLSIFTDDETIIRNATVLIYLAIILEPGRAFNIMIITSLRAVNDLKFPLIMGIISMWGIGVVVAYVLGVHFALGLVGIWIAYILDEWFRGIAMLFRWRGRSWLYALQNRP
ncbi:MATE family efflux transporter [Planococcus lenghuensis]|uniref:MATE family efflux transporter n=2 Tax=Planococcus lenghuensis TaxID=2213202 RepID=A0A1Q2L3K8_9BACL|nr:MATE family efflux transporter [Planococcus lenghuensis]